MEQRCRSSFWIPLHYALGHVAINIIFFFLDKISSEGGLTAYIEFMLHSLIVDKVWSEDKWKEDSFLKLNKFAKTAPWNGAVVFGFLCIMFRTWCHQYNIFHSWQKILKRRINSINLFKKPQYLHFNIAFLKIS